MEMRCLFAVLVVFAILLLAGCTFISSSPQPGNVTEGASNITGIETPQIMLPDINESEGDFPLPA